MSNYLFGYVYGTHRAMWILIAVVMVACAIILTCGTMPAGSITAAAGMAGVQ